MLGGKMVTSFNLMMFEISMNDENENWMSEDMREEQPHNSILLAETWI